MANTKVTGDVIANGTISTVHLADDAITAAKLDSTATGITFADLTVDTDTLYVDATNNRVGISTTSPSQKLHIVHSSTSYALAETTGTGTSAGFRMKGSASADYTLFTTQGTNQFAIYDNAAGAERMRIDSSGRVGIGTDSPNSNLQVVGSAQDQIRFGTNTSVYTDLWMGTGYTVFDSIGGNSGAFDFRDDGSSRMFIDSSGNVGIGITNPQSNLHISTSSTNAPIRLQNDNGSGSTANFVLQTDSSGLGNNGFGIYDVANSAYRLVINGSGNVGIGTTSPTQSLDTTGKIRIRDGGNTTIPSIQMGPSGIDGLSLPTTNTVAFITNSTERLRINSVGDVIIKDYGNIYASTNNSTVNSGIYFGGTDNTLRFYTSNDEKMRITSGGYTEIKATGGSSRLYLEGTNGTHFLTGTSGGDFGIYNDTASSYRMFINSSGNVGIGTTSPQSQLHVSKQGNSNGGTILMGVGGSGTNKYSVLAGVHYNQASGAGNGAGSAGIMLIGSYATNGENDVIIGGNVWEVNAATTIRFYTHTTDTSTNGGTERMRIDSNGRVGIGTTSPSYKLEVNGGTALVGGGFYVSSDQSIVTSSTYTFRDGVYINNPNSSSATVSSNSVMSIGAMSGNSVTTSLITTGAVGIGTSSPGTKLEIYGNTSSGGFGVYPALTIKNDNTSGYSAVHFNQSTNQKARIEVSNSAGSMGLYTTAAANGILINSSGNVGIGTTSPDGTLHVVGKVNTNRIVSGNLIMGNIRSNLTTTTYLLLVDLNVSAGFSLVGELNAASYTTYNVSRIYVRKNYNATTGVAVITGIAKSGSNLSVVDISHSSGRFIAIKLTGDPEIDVMWTGYRLNSQFNSDGTIKILTSGVTENSVYASY